MNTNKKTAIFSLISCFVIAAFLFATPAWSAPGKKKNNIMNPTEDSLLDLDDKKGEGKSKNKAKKKVVQKAGAAAVIGVATKKVSSGIKGTAKNVAE